MSAKRDVLCLGNAVVDVKVIPVPRLMPRGRLVHVDSIRFVPGGCAVNSAIALARLGMRTGIAAAVGRDEFGSLLAVALGRAGVDVSRLHRQSRAKTSVTAVMVHSDGERGFLNARGASRFVHEWLAPARVLRRYRALHLSAYLILPALLGAPAVRVLGRARRLGLITSLDVCWNPAARWKAVLPCLPHTDYFLPNLEEARMVFGAREPARIAAAALRAGTRRAVVLKMGARGCFALTRGGKALSVPAFRVKAADATGAGDTFDAGFLAGILRGYPLAHALRMGNAAGALCVTRGEGGASLASFGELSCMARAGGG